jgi:hypothetical protein
MEEGGGGWGRRRGGAREGKKERGGRGCCVLGSYQTFCEPFLVLGAWSDLDPHPIRLAKLFVVHLGNQRAAHTRKGAPIRKRRQGRFQRQITVPVEHANSSQLQKRILLE